MVAEEKVSKQQGRISMDEQFARNLSRLGSRYKGTEFKTVNGSSAGADEDDFTGDNGIDMKMYNSSANRLTDAEAYNREMSRQITRAEKEQSITSKCWWWMESKSFQKHTLLSLGDHVRYVLECKMSSWNHYFSLHLLYIPNYVGLSCSLSKPSFARKVSMFLGSCEGE